MANDKDFIVKNNARVRGGKLWLKDTSTDAIPSNQQHVYIDGSDGNLTLASDSLIEFHESDSPTRRVVFDCNDNKYSFGNSSTHGTTDTQGEMFHVTGSGRFGSSLNIDGSILGEVSSAGTSTQNSGNSHSLLNNVFLNPSPEAGGAIDIRTVNELAGLNTWGVISDVSGFYTTRTDATANDGDATNPSYTYSNEVISITNGTIFDGTASTLGSFYTNDGADGTGTGTGTFTLDFNGEKALNYTCYVGIVFGNTSFTAKRVKIEVYRNGAWQTECDLTNNTAINVMRRVANNNSNGVEKIRYTVGGGGSDGSTGYFRIQDVYAITYNAGGNAGPKGIHYIRRYGDSDIYGNILPAIDSTYTLGDSDQFFLGVYSDKLYLNNTAAGTTSTALILDGTEVKTRTLGSNAFSSTSFEPLQTHPASGAWFSNGSPVVGGDGVMEVGRYIDFHTTNITTEDYNIRLDCESANVLNVNGGTLEVGGHQVLTTNDEGSGNGIDADTVDGVQASSFLRSDADDSSNSVLTLSGANPTPLIIERTTDANANIKFTSTGGHTSYLGLGTVDGEINIGSSNNVQGNGNRITTVADKLNAFAATTSAELAENISDETGSGALVFGTSPTITTPTISGDATVTGVLDAGALEVDGKQVLNMPSSSTARGPWNPIVSSIRSSGKKLFADEEFAVGTNSVQAYNNEGGDDITIVREDDSVSSGGAAPNSTGKVLKISYNGDGVVSPNYGGFYQSYDSEENHTVVQIFQAKVPAGRTLTINQNYTGTNHTTYWLTNNVGTGKWEWYARVNHYGDGTSGGQSFGSAGHVSISGGDDVAFNWYLASITAIDVTESIISADEALKIKVTDNESTDEENQITFVANGASATGNQSLEMDGHLTYNPSTGTITSSKVSTTDLTATSGSFTGKVEADEFSIIDGKPVPEITIGTKIQSQATLSPRVVLFGGDPVFYAALEDNTRIYLNNVLVDTVNKGASSTIAASNLDNGDIIHSTKPVSLRQNGSPLPTLAATGQFFATGNRPDYQYLHFGIYSPYADGRIKYFNFNDINPEDANNDSLIDWSDNNAYDASSNPNGWKTKALTQGSVAELTIERSSTTVTGFQWFLADTPVVISSAASTSNTWFGGTLQDVKLLKEVTREVLSYDGGNQIKYNPSATGTITNSQSGAWRYSRSTGDMLFSHTDQGDGDGGDGVQGIPWRMCGDTYVVDHGLRSYQIATIESSVISAYYWNGTAWTLYKTHDFTDASRESFAAHSEGDSDDHGVDSNSFIGQGVADKPWRFIGTGRFALRVNTPSTGWNTDGYDDDEYFVLGYDSNLRSQETIRVGQLIAEDISADAITGEKILSTTTIDVGPSGSIKVGLDGSGQASDEIRIFAGHENKGSAPFQVKQDGALVATDATITGDITATSGTFAGTVNANAGTFTGTVNASGGAFTGNVSSNSGFTVGSAGIAGNTTTGVDADDEVRIFGGDTLANKQSAPFRVTNSGALVATNATITGAITATSGSIADSVTIGGGTAETVLTGKAHSAGSVNYNPDLTIIGSNGKPDGIAGTTYFSNTDHVSYDDSAKTKLSMPFQDVTGSIDQTTVGFPAFRVNPDAKYRVIMRWKLSSSSLNASVIVNAAEYDGDLPEGKTHVGANFSGHTQESVVQDDTRTIDVIDLTQQSSTSYVVSEGTYTPTATAEWVSFNPVVGVLNSLNNDDKFVLDKLYVVEDTSDKTQGTVGGWTVDADAIFTGTKDTSGYNDTNNITFTNDGTIHAKEFYIDSSGNAFFKGDISAASGTLSNSIQIGAGESVFKADANGIYLGNETFEDAEFRVTPAGALTATGADISGAITAESLDISSATVTGTLSASNVKIGTTEFETDASGNLSIKAGGIVGSRIADSTLDLINNTSKSGNVNRWGGYDDEGVGTPASGLTVAYDATEKALKYTATNANNTYIRSQGFDIDHNAIYRITLSIKASSSSIGNFYVGGTQSTGDIASSSSSGGGNGQTNLAFTFYNSAREDVTTANAPNFYFHGGQTHTSYKTLDLFVLGSNVDINNVPAESGEAGNPFVKVHSTAKQFGLRILNWDNGASSTKDVFIKDLEVTKIVPFDIIADNITTTNLSAISSDLGAITGGSLAIGTNDEFEVTSAGALTATGADISGDISATSLTIKQPTTTTIPSGMNVPDGETTVVMTKDQEANGNTNIGEIRLQPGYFRLARDVKREISSNLRVITPYENSITGTFYIISGEGRAWGNNTDGDATNDGRFHAGSDTASINEASNQQGFFVAKYDTANTQWKAINNNNATVNFTPASTDYCIAVGTKTTSTVGSGIDTLVQTQRNGTFVLPDNTTDDINAGITIESGGITMSSGGFIKGGQSGFNTGSDGFFLGYDTDAYKFSIGDVDGDKLTWDGSNLAVTGEISANSGNIGGVNINSDKIYVGDGDFSNNNTGFYLKSDGDFSLKNKLSFDASESTLTVNGNITAQSLSLASGLTIGQTNLSSEPAKLGIVKRLNSDPFFAHTGGTDYWYNDADLQNGSQNTVAVDADADTTYKTDGSNLPTGKSTYLQVVDNNNDSDNFVNSQFFTIDSTKTYKITVWARQPSGNRHNYLLVDFRDSSNVRINNSYQAGNTPAGSSGWASIGNYHYFGVSNQEFGSDWTKYEVQFGNNATEVTAPTDAVKFSVGGLLTRDAGNGITGTETTVEICQYIVEEFDNNDTSNAAITDLAGVTITDKKLFQGAGTHNNANTGFYLDDTGKFSLKDKLSFDGTNLSVSGSITSSSGTIGGFTLVATSLIAGSESTRVSLSTTDGISLGDNTFVDAPFSVTPAGVLKAESGTIGGLTLGADKIHLGTGTYNNANTPFYVDTSNQFSLGDKLSFTGGNLAVTGTINASAGAFTGGVTTTSTFKAGPAGSEIVGIDGSTTGGVAAADEVRIFAGHATKTSAPFQVLNDGGLIARDAAIEGVVTATSITTSDPTQVQDLTVSNVANGAIGLNELSQDVVNFITTTAYEAAGGGAGDYEARTVIVNHTDGTGQIAGYDIVNFDHGSKDITFNFVSTANFSHDIAYETALDRRIKWQVYGRTNDGAGNVGSWQALGDEISHTAEFIVQPHRPDATKFRYTLGGWEIFTISSDDLDDATNYDFKVDITDSPAFTDGTGTAFDGQIFTYFNAREEGADPLNATKVTDLLDVSHADSNVGAPLVAVGGGDTPTFETSDKIKFDGGTVTGALTGGDFILVAGDYQLDNTYPGGPFRNTRLAYTTNTVETDPHTFEDRIEITEKGIHVGTDSLGTYTAGGSMVNNDTGFGIAIGESVSNAGYTNLISGHTVTVGSGADLNLVTGYGHVVVDFSDRNFASGAYNKMSCEDSGAVGANNHVTGNKSFAVGGGALDGAAGNANANKVSGNYAISVGFRNDNSGDSSAALGSFLDQNANYGICVGYECINNGMAGFAGGYTDVDNAKKVTVGSKGGFAYGSGNQIGTAAQNSVAFGKQSKIGMDENYTNSTRGADQAFVAGYNNTVWGNNAVAFGSGNEVKGNDNGGAFGRNCLIGGIGTSGNTANFAIGCNLSTPYDGSSGTNTAQQEGCVVVGRWNKFESSSDTNEVSLFNVGTGTGPNTTYSSLQIRPKDGTTFSGIIMKAISDTASYASNGAASTNVPVGGLYKYTQEWFGGNAGERSYVMVRTSTS